jgi:hypothetical protein
MILYRLQIADDQDWINAWFTTAAEGKTELVACGKRNKEARLDKIDVPTDKEGLAWAMNMADANQMNFEGDLVARTTSKENAK